MERSPGVVSIGAPDQAVGIYGIAHFGDVSLFGSMLGLPERAFHLDDNIKGPYKRFNYATRAVYAPQIEPANVWHFGLSYDLQQFDSRWQYGGTGGSQTLVFTDTQSLLLLPRSKDISNFQNLHPEFLMIQGPFYAQAEFIFQWLRNRSNDGSSAKPKGGYAQLAYVVTGGHWEYNDEFNLPSTPYVTPGSGGEVDIALRYSYLNLNDGVRGIDVEDDVLARPGILNEVGIGVNWYVSNFVRLSANYFYTVVRAEQFRGGDREFDANVQGSTFGLRGQVRF